jgi:outer membrane lipoprotein carrier protein
MSLGLLLALAFWIFFPTPEEYRSSASELVRRFESAYRSSRTLQADFLETYFDSGKIVRSEAGIAYFAKPGKMRWEYVSPEPNLYLVDGRWAWFYVPADHTVTRTRAKESSDSRTPLAFLAGEAKVSRICKTVTLDDSNALNPQGVVLRCVLRGSVDTGPVASGGTGDPPAARESYALFEVNTRSGELLRIVVVDSGGVQVEFRFSNWQFNPVLQSSKFTFQTSKGVAIVEGDLGSPSQPSDRKPGP